MQFTILSLLPQSSAAILSDRAKKLSFLKLIEFFSSEIIHTIHDFYFEKNLVSFDAHVGDTLCQIRAYMILLMARETMDPVCLNNQLDFYRLINISAKAKIHYFEELQKKDKSKYSRELDSSVRLDKFLSENNLLFDVPLDLLFLVQARFLTTFSNRDANGITTAIDYKVICSVLKVSNTTARRMCHLFQKKLTEMSSSFVLKLSSELPHLKEYSEVLPLLQREDDNNRIVLPSYSVTRVILEHLLRNKICIVVVIDRYCREKFVDKISLFFVPDEDATSFSFSEISSEYLTQSCVVINGITTYNSDEVEDEESFTSRFAKVGLRDVLLANMACHPQYSAKELKDVCSNPFLQLSKITDSLPPFSCKSRSATLMNTIVKLENELASMQQLGVKLGCSMVNASLFFIRHIFCDLVFNHLSSTNIVELRSSQNLQENSVFLSYN